MRHDFADKTPSGSPGAAAAAAAAAWAAGGVCPSCPHHPTTHRPRPQRCPQAQRAQGCGQCPQLQAQRVHTPRRGPCSPHCVRGAFPQHGPVPRPRGRAAGGTAEQLPRNFFRFLSPTRGSWLEQSFSFPARKPRISAAGSAPQPRAGSHYRQIIGVSLCQLSGRLGDNPQQPHSAAASPAAGLSPRTEPDSVPTLCHLRLLPQKGNQGQEPRRAPSAGGEPRKALLGAARCWTQNGAAVTVVLRRQEDGLMAACSACVFFLEFKTHNGRKWKMPIWEQDSVQCAPAAHVKHSERGEQNASIWGCPSPGLLQHGHCHPTLRGAAAQLQALNGHFLPLAIILSS